MARLTKNCESRQAISGLVYITSTDAGGKKVTAPGVLLVRWPDQLRLEVQDPAGSLLLLLVLDAGKFWLYRSDRSEIVTGSFRNLPLGMALPADAQDLVRVFLARPDVAKLKAGTHAEARAIFSTPGIKHELVWDPQLGEPLEWREETHSGLRSRVTYEDYAFQGGLRFPLKVRIEGEASPAQPRSSTLLVWREWEPSVPGEKKLFQIPQQQTFGRKIKALP